MSGHRLELLLVGKPDCHLCHVMADIVRQTLGDSVALVEADVRTNPSWRSYRLEIPVLLLANGTEVARHRVTPVELRERLTALGVGLSE